MKAYQLTAWQSQPEFRDVPVPEPGPGQVLVKIGGAGGKFEFAFGTLPFEAQLTIPYRGSAIELEECLELARQGKIRAHVERFSLEDAPKAYEKMRAGELDGRAVICPHGER